MKSLSKILSDSFSVIPTGWTETTWARLAGWPVAALLAWNAWRMLPPGLNHMLTLSSWSTVMEPAVLPFGCSALFLMVVGGGYGLPDTRLGPDWSSSTTAYLLFPFIAVALLRWTNLHGWSVPVMALSPLLVLEILFALMDRALQALYRRYPASTPPRIHPYQKWGITSGDLGMGIVRELSWHSVLTSRDPVLLRKAAQEARNCGAAEMADILERRAAPYDKARLAAGEQVPE